ncbi:MAG: MFS transporter [Deltaproteobacteria bacterium]|nr:MFS transporter [Deltaproteobacteria bacterium]
MDNREQSVQRPGLTLLVIGTGTFLSAMAASTIALALPDLGRELGVSIESSRWVMQAYLMSVTSLMLVAGRLADLFGLRRAYLAGFALFGVAATACGLAPGYWALVIARLLQGIGGAFIMSTAPALLTTSFPAERRGQALGMLSTGTYAGLTIGPPLGGLIISTLGWRWVFFLNAPATILVLALGLWLLPHRDPRPGQRLDWSGTATLISGLPLLLLVLSQGTAWGWLTVRTLGVAAPALGLLGLFVAIERRRQQPLLDLALFGSPRFSGATLSAIFNYVALFSQSILLPFYLTEGLGLTSAHAGLLLTAQPLLMAIVVSPAGALSDRLGTRPLATAGMLLMAAALAGMTTLDRGSGQLAVFAWLALLGLGTGIFISPNSSALMGAAPRRQQGVAGGVMATARNLGMVIGIAVATAVFYACGGATGRSWSATDYAALHRALWVAAAVGVLGAATSLVGQRETTGG